MVPINKLALDEATVHSDKPSCWLRPVQAQTALPVMEERRRQVQQQLGQYGNHIGRFGREFVANTTELFEQVDALATVSIESMDAHPHQFVWRISVLPRLYTQAKDTIQQEMTAAATEGRPLRGPNSGRGASAGAKYSRLDSDIAAMQRDSSTYCDEPADTAAYSAWLQVRHAFRGWFLQCIAEDRCTAVDVICNAGTCRHST